MSILEKSTVIDLIKTRSASVATIAGTVAASSAVTTLLRCPGIRDGENETYTLTKEGEKPVCWVVDRAAEAGCSVKHPAGHQNPAGCNLLSASSVRGAVFRQTLISASTLGASCSSGSYSAMSRSTCSAQRPV